MHDRHEVDVLMAIKVNGGVAPAQLPKPSNLSLDLLVELKCDLLSPRVHGW